MTTEKKSLFWETLVGKKFYFHLRHGSIYTGLVQRIVDTGDGLILIEIKDKFDKYVLITASEVAEMKLEDQ